MSKLLNVLEDWFLLIGAVLVYLVVVLINPKLSLNGLYSSWSIFKNIFPDIALVFAIIFIINLLLDEKKLAGWFGKKSGWVGWLLAVVLGIASAGPIYTWYPLLADLRDKGMKDSLIAVFLYNRAIKPQLIPIMAFYFGWIFVVVLSFYMIIASIINGLLVDKIIRRLP